MEGANSIASFSSLCLTSFYHSLLSCGYSPTPFFVALAIGLGRYCCVFIVSWRNANRPGFCSDREWGVMIYLPNAGPAAHYSCAGIRIRLWESGESTYLCVSHPGAAGSSLIYLPLSAEIEKKKKRTTDITLHLSLIHI